MPLITLYHGSDHEVGRPVLGKGSVHNDFGRGFYCTKQIDIAKEWACRDDGGSFVNEYSIDTTGLKILNLLSKDYTILHWLAVLVEHRTISAGSDITRAGVKYLSDNFHVDMSCYDIVRGYRADDSYYSFVKDFLNNTIPLSRLSRAMKLGRLGEQFVLKSGQAFDRIEYLGCTEVDFNEYNARRMIRDRKALRAYSVIRSEPLNVDDVFLIDIIRGGLGPDDPRLS